MSITLTHLENTSGLAHIGTCCTQTVFEVIIYLKDAVPPKLTKESVYFFFGGGGGGGGGRDNSNQRKHHNESLFIFYFFQTVARANG